MQDFWAVGARREVAQGRNLADAARKAGVEQFVYSSVGGAERNFGILHWETKWEIENHIRKLGLPATMLRPVGFMENYYVDQNAEGFKADIDGLRRRYAQVRLHTLEQWLRNEGWHKRARRVRPPWN